MRAQLARNPLLRVVAQASSNAFRTRSGDARAISDKLGVTYLLDGNVQIDNQTMRIGAELIDGKTSVSNSHPPNRRSATPTSVVPPMPNATPLSGRRTPPLIAIRTRCDQHAAHPDPLLRQRGEGCSRFITRPSPLSPEGNGFLCVASWWFHRAAERARPSLNIEVNHRSRATAIRQHCDGAAMLKLFRAGDEGVSNNEVGTNLRAAAISMARLRARL